jgi:voltage-gated potassium channel
MKKLMTKLKPYLQLPWIQLPNGHIGEELKNKKVSAAIIDILDGDFWSSKCSIIGNFVIISCILLGTVDYLLEHSTYSDLYSQPMQIIHWVTGFVFILEIIFRVRFALYLGYGKTPWKASITYVFSFIGLIDVLATLPFVLELCSLPILGAFAAVKILRLWRIARYIESFKNITLAFQSRKEEILVTLLAVILLSLSLSAFIFHFEKNQVNGSFGSIIEVFVWSIGKYTGDYGAIAEAIPMSPMGKVLATFNGLLGIALFAIPAGLLASAFIDQLAEQRKAREISERYKKITHYFKTSKAAKHLNKQISYRFSSIDTLQARLVLSNDELFESIRECPNLRFRAMKSKEDLKYADVQIVEFFELNTTYGYRETGKDSNIHLINPIGAIERGISHFSYSLFRNLNVNFIARELKIPHENTTIASNKSLLYLKYQEDKKSVDNDIFLDFMSDATHAQKDDLIIILSSGASGRGDIIMEYGNSQNDNNWNPNTSTIKSKDKLDQIREILIRNTQKVSYRSESEMDTIQSYTLEENTIGIHQEDSLLKTLHVITGADVLAIYINIKILTGEEALYYGAYSGIAQAIDEIKKLYAKGH